MLVDDPPPLASVAAVTTEAMAPNGAASGFRIERSDGAGPPTAPVGVDSATCAECLAEVMDPADRRHRYPFTNCTELRPPLLDRHQRPVRPAGHHDGRLRDVRRVPRASTTTPPTVASTPSPTRARTAART